MKRAFIAVEGPHDVELVGALLKALLPDRRRVQYKPGVDSYWHDLIPTDFPIEDDLLKRVPVPVFFGSSTHQVAVMSAGSDSRLLPVIEETLATLSAPPDAIRLVFDADHDESVEPAARWRSLRQSSSKFDLGFALPAEVGVVDPGPPRIGCYMLPDNSSHGTLEDLLIDSAEVVYPELLRPARAFIAAVADPIGQMKSKERKAFQKPAGRLKATVSAMTAVLKPGKAVQVSIQDNRWFRDAKALEQPRLAAFRDFLGDLLGIDP